MHVYINDKFFILKFLHCHVITQFFSRQKSELVKSKEDNESLQKVIDGKSCKITEISLSLWKLMQSVSTVH